MGTDFPFIVALTLLSLSQPGWGINAFHDGTSSLFATATGPLGISAAFADVNADRSLDIILINSNTNAVDVIVMNKDGHGKRQQLTKLSSVSSGKVVGVIPADFNGDSRLDLAVLVGPPKGGGPVSVYMAYGTAKRPEMTEPKLLSTTFTDQPALIDWNGDMIADLMGETKAGSTMVLIGTIESKFKEASMGFSPWSHPAFTAFLDVNSDNQPDIFLTTKKGGATRFEVLLKDITKNTYRANRTKEIPMPPKTLKVMGGPAFADFNLDGSIQMVLPGCLDDKCTKSVLFAYSFEDQKWSEASISFKEGGKTWGFLTPDKNPLSDFLPAPVSIRPGDVNGDGFPDLVTVLRNMDGKGEERRVALLLGSGAGNWILHFPEGSNNATVAGLFDFRDQGRLGVLETVMQKEPALHALTQGNVEDSYFLKVMVLSGRCGGTGDCPEHKRPYGLPVPGPIYSYNTERPEGGRQISKACQVSQASYLAMQSPFHIFGLGTFANYIEELEVYLPNQEGSEVDRKKQFTFIVPKTQLVVIPYPLDQPSKNSFFSLDIGPRWKSKLFLEPFKDKKVLFVAVALVGTIIFVAIVIGILQWRERREDLQEKLQEAQKFHFDAM